jgi:hypothetical protein
VPNKEIAGDLMEVRNGLHCRTARGPKFLPMIISQEFLAGDSIRRARRQSKENLSWDDIGPLMALQALHA